MPLPGGVHWHCWAGAEHTLWKGRCFACRRCDLFGYVFAPCPRALTPRRSVFVFFCRLPFSPSPSLRILVAEDAPVAASGIAIAADARCAISPFAGLFACSWLWAWMGKAGQAQPAVRETIHDRRRSVCALEIRSQLIPYSPCALCCCVLSCSVGAKFLEETARESDIRQLDRESGILYRVLESGAGNIHPGRSSEVLIHHASVDQTNTHDCDSARSFSCRDCCCCCGCC